MKDNSAELNLVIIWTEPPMNLLSRSVTVLQYVITVTDNNIIIVCWVA